MRCPARTQATAWRNNDILGHYPWSTAEFSVCAGARNETWQVEAKLQARGKSTRRRLRRSVPRRVNWNGASPHNNACNEGVGVRRHVTALM